MGPKRYVICDIEATGLEEDKEIIEIALITWQDGKVTDVYETLINPLRPVPQATQVLTGISSRSLESAPKFYEVVEQIRLRLEDSVFVSHNTDFDYDLLRKKFAERGEELRLRTFCTLKVAQHEIPGLRSYSLDALCSFFRIKISDRHRAIGDAKATLELFKELLDLRLKVYPRPLYLPRHEKLLNDIAAKPGLLTFKNEKGKVIRMESAFNMQKSAREILKIQPEKKQFLQRCETVEAEATGIALIAEFKKLLHYPLRINWAISECKRGNGERDFQLRPYQKNMSGLWYYEDYQVASRKLKELKNELRSEVYLYREGGKSKEEILRQNQRVEFLSKEARFPTENLILMGEGRTINEKSFVLIRQGSVVGHGLTQATTDEIFENPERYLTQRLFRHLGANLAAKRYLIELKNVRSKNEGWRSLAEVS